MSSAAITTEKMQTAPNNSLSDKSERTFCGREVSRFDCISAKTVYTVSAVIGLALLVIGIVGLIGHCAPTTSAGSGSPIFQKLNAAVIFVSKHMGTDPLILVVFPTAFGIAFSVTGFVGIAQEHHSNIAE